MQVRKDNILYTPYYQQYLWSRPGHRLQSCWHFLHPLWWWDTCSCASASFHSELPIVAACKLSQLQWSSATLNLRYCQAPSVTLQDQLILYTTFKLLLRIESCHWGLQAVLRLRTANVCEMLWWKNTFCFPDGLNCRSLPDMNPNARQCQE